MSLETIALKNIELTSGRKLYRYKRDLIKSLVPHVDKYDLEEIGEFFRDNRVIPDSWTLVSPKSEDDILRITAIEVEDTNKLTKMKLHRYAMLWFYLDCIYIDLTLETFDRYGITCTEIPLVNVYYSMLTESSSGAEDEAYA